MQVFSLLLSLVSVIFCDAALGATWQAYQTREQFYKAFPNHATFSFDYLAGFPDGPNSYLGNRSVFTYSGIFDHANIANEQLHSVPEGPLGSPGTYYSPLDIVPLCSAKAIAFDDLDLTPGFAPEALYTVDVYFSDGTVAHLGPSRDSRDGAPTFFGISSDTNIVWVEVQCFFYLNFYPPERGAVIDNLTIVPDVQIHVSCNLADITGVGATYDSGTGTVDVPPDASLTIEDFLVFLAAFGDGTGCPGSVRCNPADLTGAGGPPVLPDGDLTIEDFIVFLSAFSDGCS